GAQLVFDNASGKILAVAPAIGTGNLDTFEFTPSVASYSTTSPTPWTCSATGAPLLMTVQGNDLPIVGATFHMELRNAAPGALLVGGVELLPALTSVPPPVTSCGCPYYQNSPVGFSFANVGPVSPFDLAIANNPALIGASFSVEGYHVDFSTCGISTTSVLRLNVGT
ncbi:MAG: hypothetical protein KDE27_15015, partial [Planctomycetes bacterium]|nr:hypothetical protein [Planctomycetota bacterium]